MRPLYYVKEARRVLRQYFLAIGAESNGRLRKAMPAAARILVARLRYGVGPMYYSLYRLSSVARQEWSNYITDSPSFKKFLSQQSPEQSRSIANNKLAFYAHCSAHDLPTIPIVCVLTDQADATTLPGLQVSSLEQWRAAMGNAPREMFVKPVDGTYGEGAFAITRSGDEVIELAGRTVSVDDLFHRLKAGLSHERGWLVQPRMRSDPVLEGIVSPHGLATARVITYMDGGRAKLFIADFKITVGTCVTDNFSKGKSGNLLAAIDRETGRLSAAWGSARTDWPVMVPFSCHPDSGRRIEGLVLPFWNDLVALALKGQDSLPSMRTIGWDIAATTAGLVLVEANSAYDVSILQVAHQRGLKRELLAALQ